MQYVRQAIAYSADHPAEVVAATEETTARKLREMQLRARSSRRSSARTQILERYLNIASFGNGAYGIYAASQVYFGKAPEGPEARRGGAARRPGQGARPPRPDRPRRRLRRSRWTGATTCSTRWSRLGPSPSRRPTRPRRSSCVRSTGKRTPERLRRHQPDRLGLLLRLLLPLVDAAGDVRRRRVRPGAAGSRAAATRIVTTLDVRRRTVARQGASARTVGREQQGRRADAGRDRAGHRPGTGTGGQPQLQDRRPKKPQNKSPATPAKARRGIRGNYPNTTNPLHHRRRRHHRLPGRLDVQDVHHGGRAGEGRPARLHDQRAERSSSPSTSSSQELAGRLRGHALLLPDERLGEHGRRTQHVDRRSAARSTRTSCRCRRRSARRT